MALPATRSIGRLASAAGALALLVGGMWVANQGGIIPDSAEAAEKFFGTIYQGVRSLPILLPVWLGALGLGLPLRAWLAPRAKHRIITQLALGLGAMLMLDWLLAACGWLNPWTAWAVCGLGTAVITYHFADPATRERWHPDHWPSPPWTVLLGLPALGLLLVACTMPPGTMWAIEAFGYDVTSYHLEVPREWLELGQMRSLTHNVYSHLPMLVEAGYMKIAIMHGSVFDAVYSIQFFHASTAVLAAAAVSRLVAGMLLTSHDRQGVGSASPSHTTDHSLAVAAHYGAAAGAVMLATPWTIITGSLAYNEMFVQVFGAAALVAMFDDESATPRGALLIGVFAGLATMAKLTAAGFVALPVAVAMIVWRWRGLTPLPLREGQGGVRAAQSMKMLGAAADQAMKSGDQRDCETLQSVVDATLPRPLPKREGSPNLLILFACFVLGAVVIVAPFLIRNAVWTGNPVFPFATNIFGSAHWSPEQVERWNKAHHSGGLADGLSKLPRQWLLNAGYGALGGGERDEQQATDIARFERENGLPLLWIMAAVSTGLLFAAKQHRRVTAALCAMLSMQLIFWLVATHHQSRFLVPTLLPGCVLVGLGLGRIAELARGQRDWLAPAGAITLTATITLLGFGTFFSQTRRFTDDSGETFSAPPYLLVDSLVDPVDVTSNQPGKFAGAHPLNQLPATSNVLLVGDANQVLYIHRPFRYSTAFDRGLLSALLREHKGNPVAVTLGLKREQVTHVWINFAELERLRASYGLDEEITPQSIGDLIKLWKAMPEVGGRKVPPEVGLFALPAVRIVQPASGKGGTSGFVVQGDNYGAEKKDDKRGTEGK